MRFVALVLTAAPLAAQPQAAKARGPVPASEWGRFETVANGELSSDGRWVAYDVRRVSGATELRYRALATESDRVVPNGGSPIFTKDSRWLLYTISPDTSGGRGGRAGRGGGAGAVGGGAGAAANRNKVGIVDLRAGATSTLEDVQSFSVSGDGAHVALRRYAPQGRQGRGADLVVRDLEQGTDVTLGNVAEFAWSDGGATLAMIVDVDGKTGNGVQVLNATTSAIRSLDAGDLLYSGLQWRPRSDDLAAFRSRVDTAFVDTSHTVLAWRGVSSARPVRQVYDFSTDATFPKEMRVASYRRAIWSDDGATLFFGIAPRELKPVPRDRAAPAPARVEVWHWKDLREYHMQDRQSAQDRTRTLLVAWHVAPNRLVKLQDDFMEPVQLSDDRAVAIATDDGPYFSEIISGRQYNDVYRVNVSTGARERVIAKAPFGASISPGGRYLLFGKGGHVWTHDLTTNKVSNLTAQAKSAFVNMEDDHPVAERRPYGTAGWTTNDRTVILYDRFDLWQVNPDGTNPTRLTRGREDSTVYRYVRLGAGGAPGGRLGGGGGRGGAAAEATAPEDRWIDPSKPLTLSATGEFNKKSGYARLTIGQPAQRLLWLDKAVGALEKARDADVFLYQTQTAAESPNYLVAPNASLEGAKPVSGTNTFLADYAWGKQVLMPYANRRGDKLQMMLTYPASYEPGKKYPMVVYYYEKLSQGFHQFIVPTERATYNTSVFSQNGYFVLRPDILFRARDPGVSGLECVTAAVKEVLAKVPDIDPKKVGNMGHSWGGYQSAFYAVNGNGLFAATIAGAPLTNFISMYGYTSFNTGSPETGHFETGQERMEVPLWEDPAAYIRNSTVFQADKLRTPLLLEEGDADGNVNPWQSHELYNFGRRLGKQVIYLLYNDENHGVARPESQQDYHRRQLEWFNHFLKGAPAPEWITRGETYLERQKLLRDAAPAAPGGGRGTATPPVIPGGAP